MPVTPIQRFHVLLALLCWKADEYHILGKYNVTSIKQVSPQLQQSIVNYLQEEWNKRSKRPRGAVIHYLCIMPGYDFKTISGEPNYDKIDEFVKSIGSNNPKKKPLNKLNLLELNKVVTQIKAMYKKQLGK